VFKAKGANKRRWALGEKDLQIARQMLGICLARQDAQSMQADCSPRTEAGSEPAAGWRQNPTDNSLGCMLESGGQALRYRG
jgi:hypothetical protein